MPFKFYSSTFDTFFLLLRKKFITVIDIFDGDEAFADGLNDSEDSLEGRAIWRRNYRGTDKLALYKIFSVSHPFYWTEKRSRHLNNNNEWIAEPAGVFIAAFKFLDYSLDDNWYKIHESLPRKKKAELEAEALYKKFIEDKFYETHLQIDTNVIKSKNIDLKVHSPEYLLENQSPEILIQNFFGLISEGVVSSVEWLKALEKWEPLQRQLKWNGDLSRFKRDWDFFIHVKNFKILNINFQNDGCSAVCVCYFESICLVERSQNYKDHNLILPITKVDNMYEEFIERQADVKKALDEWVSYQNNNNRITYYKKVVKDLKAFELYLEEVKVFHLKTVKFKLGDSSWFITHIESLKTNNFYYYEKLSIPEKLLNKMTSAAHDTGVNL